MSNENNEEKKVVVEKTQSTGGSETAAPMVDGFVNEEAMRIAKQAKEERGDAEAPKKKALPKLFVNNDELVDIDVQVIFDDETGEVFSIARPGLIDESLLDGFDSMTYTFKFKPVNYDKMQLYRKSVAFYDPQSKELCVNRLQLRSFLLINHLRETDLVGPDGEQIKIEIDEKHDNLSHKTLNLLYATMPMLMEVVLTLFEKKMLMVFQVDNG